MSCGTAPRTQTVIKPLKQSWKGLLLGLASGFQLDDALRYLTGAHALGHVFVRSGQRTQFFQLLWTGHLFIGLCHV